MRNTLLTAAALACLTTTPALAHEGGGDGEHLNVGFYNGRIIDGTSGEETPGSEPNTLLVDTHPWELDSVFYSLLPTTEDPFNGWAGEFPGFRTLLVADEELGGHGYYSWLNGTRGVETPDLVLYLVSKDADLTILDPGDLSEITDTHAIGTNTENHHLIYYVDQATGRGIGDTLTATFYLSDINGDYVDSEEFTLQFTVVPEPTSAALLGLGGLLAMRRRR